MVAVLYPTSVTPVTAAFAFVLTPSVSLAFVLFPLPIMGTDDEFMLRTNPGVLPHVPAIAFPIANNLRRGRSCQYYKAQCCEECLCQSHLFASI
jgi:hypothetical protein